MTINPDMLAAYVDGQLDGDAARRVEAAMAADPAVAQSVADQQALRARLAAHFDAKLADPVPDRLIALLRRDDAEPQAPDNVVDFAAARTTRMRGVATLLRNPVPAWGSGLAAAAALVLGIYVGNQPLGSDAAGMDGARLVASGPLATALDRQLSGPGDGGPVRILLSFRDRDGAMCRAFQGSGNAGIACRDNGGWVIDRSVASPGDGETGSDGGFRQAGSAAGEILAAAQDLAGDGSALDAAAERAARDGGWR